MFLANQKAFVICTRVTSLHSCYTFCTRVTEELHSFLSQSELSNFFVYIINRIISSFVRFIALVIVMRFIALIVAVRFLALVVVMRFLALVAVMRFIALVIAVRFVALVILLYAL